MLGCDLSVKVLRSKSTEVENDTSVLLIRSLFSPLYRMHDQPSSERGVRDTNAVAHIVASQPHRTAMLLRVWRLRSLSCFINAGSSSEDVKQVSKKDSETQFHGRSLNSRATAQMHSSSGTDNALSEVSRCRHCLAGRVFCLWMVEKIELQA